MKSVNFFVLVRTGYTSNSNIFDILEIFTEDYLAKNALNAHQKASKFVCDNFEKIQEKISNWKFEIPEPKPLSKKEKEELNNICKNSLDKKERRAATKKLQSFKNDHFCWENEKLQHKYSSFKMLIDDNPDDLDQNLVQEYFQSYNEGVKVQFDIKEIKGSVDIYNLRPFFCHCSDPEDE